MNAAPAQRPPPRRRPGGGVYIHVPFCASLCSYCRFPRTDRHDGASRRRLVAAVIAEFALRRDACATLRDGRRPALTCYVGGGTPSVLEPGLFVDLLQGTWGRLARAGRAEVTAEANPESFDEARADAWRGAGVGRVSLGVQSLDPDVLRLLGRRCDPDRARAALRLAASRFPRVSADWILAPGCRRDRLAREFAEARDLGVGHVSFYILELHAGTPLTADVEAGRVPRPRDAEVEALYLGACEDLARLGYRQYEISNFCLPGQRSRHNAAYWRRTPYLGLGPGAHGFAGNRRYANLADLTRYVAEVEAGRLPEARVDRLGPAARRLERMFLPLRTAAGAPLRDLPANDAVLARGEAEGLWRRARGRLALTPRGRLRIDDVETLFAGLAGRGPVDTPKSFGLTCGPVPGTGATGAAG
ncbi:MAG: coproporphyrinogen-III oxidase family protein [bacterium]|nr:coproporphyrinogen-III oxidase family protein [bacterium]